MTEVKYGVGKRELNERKRLTRLKTRYALFIFSVQTVQSSLKSRTNLISETEKVKAADDMNFSDGVTLW